MVKYWAVAVAVAVSGGGAVAVAVAVAGLTKRFFNHIQKDFLINVWGKRCQSALCGALPSAQAVATSNDIKRHQKIKKSNDIKRHQTTLNSNRTKKV